MKLVLKSIVVYLLVSSAEGRVGGYVKIINGGEK